MGFGFGFRFGLGSSGGGSSPPTILALNLPAISDETVNCTVTASNATHFTVVAHGAAAPVWGEGTWTSVGNTHVHTTALSGAIELDAYAYGPGGVSVAPVSASVIVIPGLYWLRSDLGITITGSGVSTWANQAAGGHNGTQGTDAQRPGYDTSGALPKLTFDGTKRLEITASPFSDPCEAIAIYAYSVGNQGGVWMFGGANAANRTPYLDSRIYDDFGCLTRTMSGAVAPAGSATPHSLRAYFDSGAQREYLDGSALWDELTGQTFSAPATCYIGDGYGAGVAPLIGAIWEIIGKTAARFTAEELAALHAYLNARYGGLGLVPLP